MCATAWTLNFLRDPCAASICVTKWKPKIGNHMHVMIRKRSQCSIHFRSLILEENGSCWAELSTCRVPQKGQRPIIQSRSHAKIFISEICKSDSILRQHVFKDCQNAVNCADQKGAEFMPTHRVLAQSSSFTGRLSSG